MMGRCQFCTTTDFFYIKVHNLCKSKLAIAVHKTDTMQDAEMLERLLFATSLAVENIDSTHTEAADADK